MSEEQTQNRRAEYKVVAYEETVSNDGNLGNRKYYAEVEPNGATYQDCIEMVKQDIDFREAMHERHSSLQDKIIKSQNELDWLKEYVTNISHCFMVFKAYLGQNKSDNGGSKKVKYSWGFFKSNVKMAQKSLKELQKLLEI